MELSGINNLYNTYDNITSDETRPSMLEYCIQFQGDAEPNGMSIEDIKTLSHLDFEG